MDEGSETSQKIKDRIIDFYFKNSKKLILIPATVLLIALVLIFMNIRTKGDFINRDVTLKGGITITVLHESSFDQARLESALSRHLFPNDVSVRTLNSGAQQVGILIESDIEDLSGDKLNSTIQLIGEELERELTKEDYSFETMGSSLGKSFFLQLMKALIFAFLFMGLVVFLYFRTFVPSVAVIMSAVSDIIVTIAVINIIGFKIGTAGIAGLLMLIGYSVDTDILLVTRILKRKEYTIRENVIKAFKTGMTMTITTIAAVTVGLIFTQSEIVRQIMVISLIGSAADIMNTWLQNCGLLLWYTSKRAK